MNYDVDHTYIKHLLLMMDINYVILLFFVFQTKYFFWRYSMSAGIWL
jgi:hypothetical protein